MDLPQNRLLRGGALLFRRYLRHGVGIQSAALAFYLLFMLFPFLIFVSALLGILQLDVAAILGALGRLLPREAAELAGMYLTHVSENPDHRLLLFGLFFSVWFPMRAANALMRAVRTAYHLGPPRRPVIHTLKTLVYTLLLLATIAVTLTVLSITETVLDLAVVRFGLPQSWAALWGKLRFPVVGAAAFGTVFGLYALSQDRRQPWRAIWPGALCALTAWLAMSGLYGWYMANFAHYSLLYGSIGTVMAVLVWLYATGAVLILGAELNSVLEALRRENMAKL